MFDTGFYPPDLILLESTSITLTELDSMDKERKAEYILFIMERKRREKEELEKQGGGSVKPKATYYSEADFSG
jgi:hypothetical protein